MRGDPLTEDFFRRPVREVARDLVGVTLQRGDVLARIVETEAYADDAASHYVTRRHTAAMMGDTHGRIYVYTIYGMHRCVNFTADADGPGGVLLRAMEPIEGHDVARRRRAQGRGPGTDPAAIPDRDLMSGPAKLFQALGLSPDLKGRPALAEFDLHAPDAPAPIVTAPRVGVSAAADLPWRYCLADSPWVSRPRPG